MPSKKLMDLLTKALSVSMLAFVISSMPEVGLNGGLEEHVVQFREEMDKSQAEETSRDP